MDLVRSDEIWQRLNVPSTICEEVYNRRIKWFGHVIRMPHHRLLFQAFQNDFTQRRPPGRPPTRWKTQIQGDLGKSLQEAEHKTRKRTERTRITCRRASMHKRRVGRHLSQVKSSQDP